MDLNKFQIPMLFVLLAFASAARGAPFQLTYSGRLTESNGSPVAGPVDLQIKFFDQQTAGAAMPVVLPVLTDEPLSQGVFTVNITLSAVDYHSVFDGAQETWIEVKDVTHNKTYPRQRFSAVPYALKVPVDGMTIGWTANGELEVLGSGSGPIDGSDIASGTIDAARLPGASGSTNGILSSADWTTFNAKQTFITAGGAGTYLAGNKTFQTLDTAAVAENAGFKYFTDARAKGAAVANTLLDNVTDVAPSQDAVFEKFQNLTTADIAEDPGSLYYTDARAKAAAVDNALVNGETNVAPSQDVVFDQLATKVNASDRNIAGGFVGLNGSSLIDPIYLPYAGLTYRGVWNSATNTPALPTPGACVTEGEYYITTVGSTGVTTLDGISNWSVGDWVICSATNTWQRVGSSSGVSTINGQTGSTITLDTDDVLDTTATNKYYSDALARAAFTGSAPIGISGGGVVSISAATTGAAGSMSAADKTKLDAIATGADDVNTANVAAAGAVMDSDYTGNGMIARNGAAGTYSLVANNSANWDTAYTDRLNWDGGATGLNATTAKTSLGLVIGTNVQAYDATLSGIAALAPTANQLVYATGADSFATTALTAAGRSLIDDASVAAQQATLSLVPGTDLSPALHAATLASVINRAARHPFRIVNISHPLKALSHRSFWKPAIR